MATLALDREEIKRMVDADMSIAAIAKELGATRQGIYKALKAAPRQPRQPRPKPQPRQPNQFLVVERMKESPQETPVVVTALEPGQTAEVAWYSKLEESLKQFDSIIDDHETDQRVKVAAIAGKATLASNVLKAWTQMQMHSQNKDPTKIPAVQVMVAKILMALEQYPEAKKAVLGALD